jgi:hypothetical protein
MSIFNIFKCRVFLSICVSKMCINKLAYLLNLCYQVLFKIGCQPGDYESVNFIICYNNFGAPIQISPQRNPKFYMNMHSLFVKIKFIS